MKTPRPRFILTCGAAALIAGSIQPAPAADDIWLNNGPDNNYSNPLN